MKFYKYILLTLILVSAHGAYAQTYFPDSTCTFTVSGAGTGGIDGSYTWDGRNNSGVNEFSLNGLSTPSTPILVYSFANYYELRQYDNTVGFYYDSNGSAGSYETFDSVNTGGTAPVPTVTSSGCGVTPPPPPVSTTTQSTTTPVHDDNVSFGLAIIITLLTVMVCGLFVGKRKK